MNSYFVHLFTESYKLKKNLIQLGKIEKLYIHQ